MEVRRPLLAGNWKMHKSIGEARTLARGIRDGAAENAIVMSFWLPFSPRFHQLLKRSKVQT